MAGRQRRWSVPERHHVFIEVGSVGVPVKNGLSQMIAPFGAVRRAPSGMMVVFVDDGDDWHIASFRTEPKALAYLASLGYVVPVEDERHWTVRVKSPEGGALSHRRV